MWIGGVRIVTVLALDMTRRSRGCFGQTKRDVRRAFRRIVHRWRRQNRMAIDLILKFALDIAVRISDSPVVTLKTNVLFTELQNPLTNGRGMRPVATLTAVV